MRAGSDTAVVDEMFARRYFLGEDPIGRRFGTKITETTRYRIVGVDFTAKFTHVSERESRMQDLPTTLCANLIAEAISPPDGAGAGNCAWRRRLPAGVEDRTHLNPRTLTTGPCIRFYAALRTTSGGAS
jgi:hypothetical protein